MVLFDFPEEVQQFLCAAHRKGRNDHAASPAERLSEDFGERRNRRRYEFMDPCAVSRFNQQIIRLFHRLRIVDNRLFKIAHITGAYEFPCFTPVFQEQFHKRGTE